VTANRRHPFRRKNHFVKKSFQSSFALRFAGLIAIEAFLMAVFFLYLSRGTLTTAYANNELTIQRTATFFFTTLLIIGAITAVAMALIGTLVFVIFSHRIAGPVYRLQKSLDGILHGDLVHHIRLRRKDELGDLAGDVNRLSEFLDSRIGEMKREIRRVSAAKTPAEAAEALKRLEDIAGSFKTSS
jgi:methyl-accepting chemotaxis protein